MSSASAKEITAPTTAWVLVAAGPKMPARGFIGSPSHAGRHPTRAYRTSHLLCGVPAAHRRALDAKVPCSVALIGGAAPSFREFSVLRAFISNRTYGGSTCFAQRRRGPGVQLALRSPNRWESDLTSPAYTAALRVMSHGVDTDLHRALLVALEPVSGSDPVIYLADYAHLTLIPVPTGSAGRTQPDEEIATTMAGRAFIGREPVTAERDEGIRVWVPLLEGTMRTGVLAVTLPTVNEEMLIGLEMLGVFAGLVLAATAPLSDLSHLRRRGRAMSLAATMQWGLMPPLSAATDRASIAGVLEPAYDIAGDGFDYAINGDAVEFAILDGMGHGVASSMLTGLAIGAYRHSRRERSSLRHMHAAIEAAVADQYAGEAFATGILGRLSSSTGELDWSCAGHPAPLLLRDRKVIAELTCEPNLPFGLGDDAPVNLGMQVLEPGDAVLLYTDGVVEARTASGEEFGLERLIDLFEREAASERVGEELLRRVVRAVVDYQVDELRDDATMLLIGWTGTPRSAESDIPGQRSAVFVG
jgi:hypothetical protein